MGIHRQGFDNREMERVLAEMGPAAADVPLRALYHSDQDAWREQVEALFAENPGDPAYYRHHSEWYSYMYPGNPFPPDYRAKWKALDPGNAQWALSVAENFAGKSFSRSRTGTSVTSEPMLQEALGWITEAAACDHYRLPPNVIMKRQLRSFHDDGTRKAVAMKGLLASQVREESPFIYSLVEALAVEAERMSAAGDRDGLAKRMADLRKIVRWVVDEAGPGRKMGVLYPFRFSGPKLEAACTSLGLAEEAAWVANLKAFVNRQMSGRPRLSPFAREESALHRFASQTPGVTAEDLTPGRMAEHAVADRFMALTGALIAFLLLGGGSLELLRRGSLLRDMARGVAPVFRKSDIAWVMGLGGIAPALWWIGIVHFSPLGCRDIGLAYFEFNRVPMMQPWLSQGFGGLVLLLAALLQTVRWRLAKRAAFLSLAPPRMWVGWVMVTLAALFVPAQGIARYLPAHPEKFLLFGSAAGGIALLWLLWRAAMALLTPREQALGGVLALRLLLPAWMAAGLALVMTVPVLRSSERMWMARDTLSQEVEGVSGLVRKYLAAIEPERRELRKLLE